MADPIRIVTADLDRPDHADAVLALTDAYAVDPMGGGEPLSPAVRDGLIGGLRAHPTTVILLAFAGDEPAGIATCFLGFSTFSGRPLLNIHDFAVAPAFRGQGVGRVLMEAVEDKARELGATKLTLEVGEKNTPARAVYERAGFSQPDDTEAGALIFYTRMLDP
ncbi:MAG: GNAT family N-acetyltransferase [Actinomycetota bacterium]